MIHAVFLRQPRGGVGATRSGTADGEVEQQEKRGTIEDPSRASPPPRSPTPWRSACATTAWVCAADHQAYQLAHDLPPRGLRVPEDVSITGFDGLDPAAVTRLVNRIQHPTAPQPQKILVEAELVAGEMIAKPAGA